MVPETASLDSRVRLLIYQHFIDTGGPPTKSELAYRLELPLKDIAEAVQRLGAGKALVLQPLNGEVLMAEPFSAVPTAFQVESEGRSWWGNCIWDALGIPAMLNQDAHIRTSCGDCNEALVLTIRAGKLQRATGVVHYSVPPRRWWDDVVFA